MRFLIRLFVISLVVLVLGMLEARIGFGAEIELSSAGQVSADPQPYYKGAQ